MHAYILYYWHVLLSKNACHIANRCLDYGIIPLSCRLKNPIRTPRSYDIIRRAETQLMNERVGNINNFLDMICMRRDICRNQLELFSECLKFIARIKQVRYLKTLTRQLRKFNRLQHKYNGGVHSYNSKHVHSVSLLNRYLHMSITNTGNDNTENNRINNDNNNSNLRGDSDNNNDDTNKNWSSTCLTALH